MKPLGSISRPVAWIVAPALMFAGLRPVPAQPAPAAPSGPAAPKTPAAAPSSPAPTATCPAGSTPTQVLTCATNFFEHGDHREVVRLLRPIVERGRLTQKADLTEALRIYGISLHLTGRSAAAELVFARLVVLDPTAKLDPRLVPPEVVLAFARVRKHRLAELLRRKLGKRKKRYAILNFLPPAGQFQNGHHTKAWIVLGLEVGFLAMNIASYFALRSSRLKGNGTYVVQDIDGNIVEDHRTEAKALMGINYASFGLLLATVVYGVVDGWVYMKRLERQELRRRRFLIRQIQVSALTGPSAAGVSLKLEF